MLAHVLVIAAFYAAFIAGVLYLRHRDQQHEKRRGEDDDVRLEDDAEMAAAA